MTKNLIFSLCTAFKWLAGIIFGIILDNLFTTTLTRINLIILELGFIFIFLFLAIGQWLKQTYYKSEFEKLEIELKNVNENRTGLIADRERLLNKIDILEIQINNQQLVSKVINQLTHQTTNEIGDNNDIQENRKNNQDN